jgi:dihydrofolate reductase
MIWAQSRTGVIGRDGSLPWRLPEDMAHFREVTDRQPVIMGRRTWESLPVRFRPLPGRRTIVLTRRSGYRAPGAEVVGSLAEAVRLAGADRDGMAWLAGGADVYAAGADELASVAHVTEVDIDPPGDTYAPSLAGWVPASTGDWLTSSTGLRYRFLRYHRERRP